MFRITEFLNIFIVVHITPYYNFLYVYFSFKLNIHGNDKKMIFSNFKPYMILFLPEIISVQCINFLLSCLDHPNLPSFLRRKRDICIFMNPETEINEQKNQVVLFFTIKLQEFSELNHEILCLSNQVSHFA